MYNLATCIRPYTCKDVEIVTVGKMYILETYMLDQIFIRTDRGDIAGSIFEDDVYKYFEVYCYKSELLEILKEELSLNDTDIYQLDKREIWIKFNKDIIKITATISTKYDNFINLVDFKILSNDLPDNMSFTKTATRDNIKRVCGLIKFICND